MVRTIKPQVNGIVRFLASRSRGGLFVGGAVRTQACGHVARPIEMDSWKCIRRLGEQTSIEVQLPASLRSFERSPVATSPARSGCIHEDAYDAPASRPRSRCSCPDDCVRSNAGVWARRPPDRDASMKMHSTPRRADLDRDAAASITAFVRTQPCGDAARPIGMHS